MKYLKKKKKLYPLWKNSLLRDNMNFMGYFKQKLYATEKVKQELKNKILA